MIRNHPIFDYGYRFAGLVDAGKKRAVNEDEVICCPEHGFFAVSDGMGGLTSGGKTSDMVKQVMPGLIKNAYKDLSDDPAPDHAAALLMQQVAVISDSVFETGNRDGHFCFGATICGVWLVGDKAVFVNLGDSRGYYLPRYKKTLNQITLDHNIAGILVERGELTKSEAKNHPASSRLTRFVGMETPSSAEAFIVDVQPGDRLLVCSDGLHGIAEEDRMRCLMRSSRSPKTVCRRLINEANANGGRDNISTVYIKITG